MKHLDLICFVIGMIAILPFMLVAVVLGWIVDIIRPLPEPYRGDSD